MNVIKTEFSNTYFEFDNGFSAVIQQPRFNPVLLVNGKRGGIVKPFSPNYLKAQMAIEKYLESVA